ncbi:MAG TPA: cupin domain-containing protein [Burkholderiales bacterium]|nr:cupin domain-containing protein [Burkholderiales bacterium]
MKTAALLSIVIAGLATISLARAQAISVTPDQLKWTRNPATGSEIAVVMGDPRKPGPFILRVRYQPTMKAMPHSHPADVQVTVISGTLLYGEGEKFDQKKMKQYPAGSFFVIGANVPHYEAAKGVMVFQANGTGPQVFNFVNPKDDPKNKKK